jgi:hypothetical protein
VVSPFRRGCLRARLFLIVAGVIAACGTVGCPKAGVVSQLQGLLSFLVQNGG